MMMLSGILFSSIHKSGDGLYLLWSGLITIGAGLLMYFIGKDSKKQVNKRERYLIVALGWWHGDYRVDGSFVYTFGY